MNLKETVEEAVTIIKKQLKEGKQSFTPCTIRTLLLLIENLLDVIDKEIKRKGK